jgi:hypothetical protein
MQNLYEKRKCQFGFGQAGGTLQKNDDSIVGNVEKQ